MVKVLLIFFISFFSLQAIGQGGKKQVLIYGNSEACWAAAVQSSRSGVNTLWITDTKSVGKRFEGMGNIQITNNKGLDAGLWAEVLQKVSGAKTLNDSALNRAKHHLNPQLVQNAFSTFIDSASNLTVVDNVQVNKIKKSGDRWKVYLSTNQRLKVNAIIDGSADSLLTKLLEREDRSDSYAETTASIPKDMYENTLFRTGLIVTDKTGRPSQIPASAFLNTPAINFFVISQYDWLNSIENANQDIALIIQSGQAIGATAAYCAFFKTTTEKINIRMLQGELMAYYGRLVPFQDIPIEDVHFGAVQRIGATGVLHGEYTQHGDSIKFYFNPGKLVSSKEIEPIMLQLYTRSQLWFKEKDIDSLRLKDLLDLIKFTALKGDEVNADVEREWNSRFKFAGVYDLECYLTRRQVAVLIDYYLKPFHVKVDEKGKFKS